MNVDLDKAREDNRRWKHWHETIISSKEIQRRRHKEVNERIAQQAAAEEAEAESSMDN